MYIYIIIQRTYYTTILSPYYMYMIQYDIIHLIWMIYARILIDMNRCIWANYNYLTATSPESWLI